MIDLDIARRAAEACVLTRKVEGATIHPRNMVLMMVDEIERLRDGVKRIANGCEGRVDKDSIPSLIAQDLLSEETSGERDSHE